MNRWVPMGALEADATAAAAAPASEAVSPEPPPMSRSRLTSTYFRQLSIRNTHQVAVLCIIQYYVLIRINTYFVLLISAVKGPRATDQTADQIVARWAKQAGVKARPAGRGLGAGAGA